MSIKTNVSYDSQEAKQLGEINITTSVLETIAAQAALKVEGLYVPNPSFQKVSGSFFSSDRDKIWVKVRRNEEAIVVDVDIRVRYGYSVPDVAMNVQARVKEQVLFMTDLVIDEVNVHVHSVEADAPEVEVFHLDDENGDTIGE